MPIVKQIEGTDNKRRLEELKKLLKKHKIAYKVEKYSSGENIIIGKGKTLFVAHHDTVPRSPGANDDASAIAVLIGLAKARKAAIAIFDEEELYCIGSKEYIKRHKMPKAVVALEMMGMGDMMALWPVDEERKLLNKIRIGLKKIKMPFEEAQKVPSFWADFTAFREAGLKDAWCLTLVPSSEKELIRNLATRPLMAVFGMLFTGLPKFFKHYHSTLDTSKALSEEALQLSLKAVISVYDELHRKP